MSDTIPRFFLKPKEEDRILAGHLWVYDNEIGMAKIADKDLANNFSADQYTGIADVYTKSGLFLGRGFCNPSSKIRIRLFSRSKDQIDDAFIYGRIESAVNLRRELYAESDSCRLIFAEADFLPGLIVDKYTDLDNKAYLSIQFLSKAVETYRAAIIDALQKIIRPAGMYERSDVFVRTLEGLEETKGFISEPFPTNVTILENGIKLSVDIANGQKTGYFLDQKNNRMLLRRVVKGKKVLDTFTHTGAFGLNATVAGAASVVSIDISEEAVAQTKHNIALNHAESTNTVLCADVFDSLKEYEQQNEQFDVIILDPPAFTKSARMAEKAYGGYKEINLRAMKILTSGGFLMTCSCSHFFTEQMFYNMLHNAAKDAHKQIQIFSKSGAGFDHPILMGYSESEYLCCALVRVW